ncbi:hypothetical protein [Agrobacterium sp. DSM 25558]|uniref:hypothetical protein n=1 Tax=Agrobacterium sp. DSM 25558 TaxID=1907665 RepID=UPI0011776530|nr:hypothetical protein [Agrobacterium sp. DSM 25558]
MMRPQAKRHAGHGQSVAIADGVRQAERQGYEQRQNSATGQPSAVAGWQRGNQSEFVADPLNHLRIRAGACRTFCNKGGDIAACGGNQHERQSGRSQGQETGKKRPAPYHLF